MKIENQVCTVQQGKRLQELGVNIEPIFNHCVSCPDPLGENFYTGICYIDGIDDGIPGERIAPAYTVAELGELLPKMIETGLGEFAIVSYRIAEQYADNKGLMYGWICEPSDEADDFMPLKVHPTEAQARAAMLIYLLENNLLTPNP